jgi:hypothetical protein
MESPPAASSKKPMPQIVTPSAPPPNPQVIATDSTEIAEDSTPVECSQLHVLARRRKMPCGPSTFTREWPGWRAAPPSGTTGRGHNRGSSGRGRALGAVGPSATGLCGQAVPNTAVGSPRGAVAGDLADAPATVGASGHRRSTPKVKSLLFIF